MRCVYSKNKSLSSHTKTQPVAPAQQPAVKRTSLIVAPISVTSNKSKLSVTRKITLTKRETSSNSNLMKTQLIKPMKLIEAQEIDGSSRLTEKPSIINLLYENDPQLFNEKVLNEMKYQETTRQFARTSGGNKIKTEGNIENRATQEQKCGLTLTRRFKSTLDTQESQQSGKRRKPCKLAVTISKHH